MHWLSALSGHAQEAASETAVQQRDRQRLTQLTLPVSALTNRDIGDLRWVNRLEPPATVTVSTWQSLFFSDNVYRTPENRRESLGWNGDVAIQVVPYATGRWTPWISADYFRFRYDREPSQDFDGQVLNLGSRLDVSHGDPLLWEVSYSLWRFVDGHHRSDEFFKQGLLENYFTWTHVVSSRPAVYSEISYGVAFRHASPDRFDRVENEFILSLHYFPWRDLQITGFARPGVRQYLADETGLAQRNDLHFETGLMMIWDWTRNFSTRGEVDWIWNDSNRSGEDYRVLESQVALFVQLGF